MMLARTRSRQSESRTQRESDCLFVRQSQSDTRSTDYPSTRSTRRLASGSAIGQRATHGVTVPSGEWSVVSGDCQTPSDRGPGRDRPTWRPPLRQRLTVTDTPHGDGHRPQGRGLRRPHSDVSRLSNSPVTSLVNHFDSPYYLLQFQVTRGYVSQDVSLEGSRLRRAPRRAFSPDARHASAAGSVHSVSICMRSRTAGRARLERCDNSVLYTPVLGFAACQ
jgi:hypothetical protein